MGREKRKEKRKKERRGRTVHDPKHHIMSQRQVRVMVADGSIAYSTPHDGSGD